MYHIAYRSLESLVERVPEGKAVGTNPTSARDPKLDLDFPPIKTCWLLWPYHSLLGPQWWGYSYTFFACDRIPRVLKKWNRSVLKLWIVVLLELRVHKKIIVQSPRRFLTYLLRQIWRLKAKLVLWNEVREEYVDNLFLSWRNLSIL